MLSTAAMTGLFFAGMGFSSNANAASNVSVQSGDTLWGISQQYNTSVDSLASANNMNSNDILPIGKSLTIPDFQSSNNSQRLNQTQTSQPQYHSNIQTASVQPTTATQNNQSNTSDSKEWIANRESTGSYSASNGQYYGRYQVSAASLNGDYSAANQERVADQYVQSRYGSWDNAKSFWQANGWY